MFGKADKIILGTLLVLGTLAFVFRNDIKAFAGASSQSAVSNEGKKGKKDKGGKDEERANVVTDVVILEKWDLPEDLLEVSGIAYMDEQRFACVQDESGTIYVYNIVEKKIEKEIPFAAAGDYEGIALKGQTAYVLRADGKIYEVDMKEGRGNGKEYATGLTEKHNVEGLTYDAGNDRLLLAIKDDEPSGKNYKGIYAFDLAGRKFNAEPVFRIDLDNEIFSGAGKKKAIKPSEIAIHPETKEIYITDGPKARLLIMDDKGGISKLLELGKDFSQPEGIAFSPDGTLFISNEGTGQPGNIVKVELKK